MSRLKLNKDVTSVYNFCCSAFWQRRCQAKKLKNNFLHFQTEPSVHGKSDFFFNFAVTKSFTKCRFNLVFSVPICPVFASFFFFSIWNQDRVVGLTFSTCLETFSSLGLIISLKLARPETITPSGANTRESSLILSVSWTMKTAHLDIENLKKSDPFELQRVSRHPDRFFDDFNDRVLFLRNKKPKTSKSVSFLSVTLGSIESQAQIDSDPIFAVPCFKSKSATFLRFDHFVAHANQIKTALAKHLHVCCCRILGEKSTFRWDPMHHLRASGVVSKIGQIQAHFDRHRKTSRKNSKDSSFEVNCSNRSLDWLMSWSTFKMWLIENKDGWNCGRKIKITLVNPWHPYKLNFSLQSCSSLWKQAFQFWVRSNHFWQVKSRHLKKAYSSKKKSDKKQKHL